MQVFVTVVSVEIDIQVAKKDGGTYPGSRLTYRTQEGKIQEQAFHMNALKFNAPLKASLTALVAGDSITIEKEKNKNDFWEVKSITKSDGAQAPASNGAVNTKPTASPKSTYETPEERAKKQVYIVRQSSITAALTFLAGKKASTVQEVTDIAKQFENYVMGTEFDDGNNYSVAEDDDNDII